MRHATGRHGGGPAHRPARPRPSRTPAPAGTVRTMGFRLLIRQGARQAQQARRLRLRLRLAAAVMLLAGIACLAAGPAAHQAADMQVAQAASMAAPGPLPSRERTALIRQADAYNARLAAHPAPPSRDADTPEYRRLLDTDGNGTIGAVSIPRIGADLPIGHGTDTATLDLMAGHIPGTALPVGGKGTRTAIAAHDGTPGARLFQRLTELRDGDPFVLRVLDRTLVYQVISRQVTTPDRTDLLTPIPGRDLATLVTCTGPGNTKRLLVTGERVHDTDARTAADTDTDPAMPAAMTAGGVAAMGLTGVGTLRLLHPPRPTGGHVSAPAPPPVRRRHAAPRARHGTPRDDAR